MIDPAGFVVTDLACARRFYDAIAKPLGLSTADNPDESFDGNNIEACARGPAAR